MIMRMGVAAERKQRKKEAVWQVGMENEKMCFSGVCHMEAAPSYQVSTVTSQEPAIHSDLISPSKLLRHLQRRR